MNCGCGGWVSSFIIVCYGYVSGEAIYPSMWLKSRQSKGRHSVFYGAPFIKILYLTDLAQKQRNEVCIAQ